MNNHLLLRLTYSVLFLSVQENRSKCAEKRPKVFSPKVYVKKIFEDVVLVLK